MVFRWGAARRLNALEQLTAMREAGLLVPDHTTDIREAWGWVKEGALVFGRKLYHSQGRDIVGPGPRADRPIRRWRESEWWSKVVPDVVEEWRIHVFDGKSIARGKKVQTGPSIRKQLVRNRANGWSMIHTERPSDALREAAKGAVNACGYEYGGVDLFVRGDGSVGVFEVNTAVGLDDYTASAYARAVVRRAAG
jgi:hypothetical protein